MEINCPSTSVMASRIPTPLSTRPNSSLAFSSSSFFSYGGRRLSRRSLSLVSTSTSSRRGHGPNGVRCLFGLGVPELAVIAGVAALVFGPKKLPEIGRSIGKSVKSFQQAAKEFETELKKEPEDVIKPENPEPVSSRKEEIEASVTKENV